MTDFAELVRERNGISPFGQNVTNVSKKRLEVIFCGPDHNCFTMNSISRRKYILKDIWELYEILTHFTISTSLSQEFQ